MEMEGYNMSFKYRTISRQEIYKGKIVTLVKDKVLLPNDKIADREIVLHKGAAAIVPIDETGKIIFVRQYRQPVGEELLEIPAGLLEKGEEPIESAKRELEEETGYKASEMHHICSMFNSAGFSNEMVHLYLAKGLHEGKQNLDEDEFVEIERYTFDEALKMIFDGRIKDSKSISGILGAKYFMNIN